MGKLMYKLLHDEINQKYTSLQQCQAKDNLYNSISCHLGIFTCTALNVSFV